MHTGPLSGTTLSAEQMARMEALLDELLDLPEGQRGAALQKKRNDPAVTTAVRRWLDAVRASNDFLSSPVRPSQEHVEPETVVGMRLGAWRLTRLVGRGGMGDVYEAIRADGEFDQRVAIKLMQRETTGELRRFQTERQILARLEHPGIARLYDGGVTQDRRLYMVMEYVEGRSITEFCALQECALQQRLDLFIQVCDAVAFAHRNHVIHRDLKPSNILVTSDGVVKLLDFGIAQFEQAQLARITQTAAAPMTPICAAPEQLTGHETSPATDVYALGLLLFELLTGAHPWLSQNTPILQAMRTVLERPAPLASRVAEEVASSPVAARRIQGDLDAIIEKCLRKEPGHRYVGVEALKADTQRFLQGEAVEARKHVLLYKFGHAVRRYRWPIGTSMVVAMLLAAGWYAMPRQTPQTPPGHTVALVGFANLSRQEQFAWIPAALTAMLDTELSSASEIRVLPQALVRDASKGADDSAEDKGAEALRSLGRRLGADYVISGDYLLASPTGEPTLRIDIAIQDVRSGNSVAKFSQQAGISSLSDLVGKIGAVLRNKLGSRSPSTELLAQISQAQPPSVDIAEKMSIADVAMQGYEAAKARDELLQIVAQSPGFAPAYAGLADAWSALGYREKAVAAAQQAITHGSGLPQEMQLRIDAVLQAANYQWAKAAGDWNALIKLKPDSPEFRLQAINTALSSGSWTAARSELAELRRLPGTAQDPRIELTAARIACALDDSKSCAERAQEALRLALDLGAPGLTADVRTEIAVAQLHLGHPDIASDNLHQSMAAYRKIGNPHGEAEVHRELGRVLVSQERQDEARAEYQQAMAIDQRIGDLGGVSAVYRNLCELLWEEGDRDGARAAAQRGLDLSRQTGDLKLQAWTLRALATIASDDAASDEVMRNFREVTALTERSGDRGGHVWSLATYAEITRLRGELTEAGSVCAQALAEASKLTDPQFAIYSTYTCALVEMDAGHADKASDMFREVERTSEKANNTVYLANARLMLGQMDMEQKHYEEALKKLGQAIEGFMVSEAKTGEAEAEAMRALCYQQIGDTKQRDVALARARLLRTAITSRLEIYIVDIASAQLQYQKGQHRDAIVRLNALAADASHRHWIRWSLEAQLAAWQLAQAEGERASAARLQRELEKTARARNMGRVLALVQSI